MRLGSCALVLALAAGCGDSSTTATHDGPFDAPVGNGDGPILNRDGPIQTSDGPIQTSDGAVVITDDGGTHTCYVTSCNGKVLECGDCVDNDGDGTIDWRDPECLGPCDNTEGPALTAGIGGETGGPCKADCYFDFGNGPGNDDCHWDHRCDPLAVAPSYPPEGAECPYEAARVGGTECPAAQSAQCLSYCMPLTPNGCDCFGCCTFPVLSGGHVWIGAMDEHNLGTCTFADIQDPAQCPSCTPVADCYNGCGHCELCLGKPELPADCFPRDGGVPDDGGVVPDAGVPERCPDNIQPCGLAGEADCPASFYCITGCCQATIL